MGRERARVIVTRRWPAAVEDELDKRFDVVLNTSDQPFDREQLREALRTADALCPTVTDAIGADLLTDPAIRVRLIANFGVGFEHIDIAAAKDAGIAVSNTPGVLTDCTADLAMTLILMTARRTGEGERELRAGDWIGWRPTHLLGTRVSGKTLGIVGAGRIGTATARRAHLGLGMRILFHSRSPVRSELLHELDAEQCELAELLEQSDFVSLHCPSTPQTHHLIDADRLSSMRPGAMLINTARGDVVEESALVDALENGIIAGAGLDVYEQEPRVSEGLLRAPNTVLLPHMGSGSQETRVAMGMCAVENLLAFFAGKVLPNPV